MITVNLKLYGAFRTLGSAISLPLDEPALVKDIAPALKDYITKEQGGDTLLDLLPASRFATPTEILSENTMIKPGIELAILPPVSGG